MRREPSQLCRNDFDLLVVGGGIYGAWATLDAAQRGLRVALIERGDFASATSGNHHRIIHGGLRYLQHADLRRFRESVRERSILMRTAPELVRPLPVLVPTMRAFSQRRLTMWGAMKVNDVLSFDRNRGVERSKRLGAGRLVGVAEASALAEGFDFSAFSGGALFHDAQILSPERLVVSILQAAAAAGANVANYVSAEEYLRAGGRICGVRARDVLSGQEMEIRAELVMNCAGPWTRERMAGLPHAAGDDRLRTFKAAVLAIRDVGLRAALAVPGRAEHRDRAEVLKKDYRNLFLTPWRGLTLAGTFYSAESASGERCMVSEAEIESWVGELNRAWPSLRLDRGDVLKVYAGYLPRAAGASGEMEYAKRYAIIDHERENGTPGVISVLGVKFTTARGVAERAVNLACAKLGHAGSPCRTDQRLEISGGELIEDAAAASARLARGEGLLREVVERACREELACTLEDVVQRRTDLAAAGEPAAGVVERCGEMMGELMGWDMLRIEREVRAARGMRSAGGCMHAA